jgi:molybdopterin synthase catalytic subunit
VIRTALTREAIEPEEVLRKLWTREDGAVLLFLGVVRNHNRGRAVEGLTYEAYREMAENVLESLVSEAEDRYGTDRIVLLHRIGELSVGEVSTAIAVATPHREEAYAASRYLIEELKERLPVWKEERYRDGGSEWVGGREPGKGGGGP